MNFGILPISLLFYCRAAICCHSIMNKKKPGFSSSALKLPTASFYIHEWTEKFLAKKFQNAVCMKKVLLREVFCSTILFQEIICQCHTILQRRNISSFFLMNTRRTRRISNMVQLLETFSVKFISFYFVLNLCYFRLSPPIQVISLFCQYFIYHRLLVFSVYKYQFTTLPVSVNFTMTETYTDIRRITVLLFFICTNLYLFMKLKK